MTKKELKKWIEELIREDKLYRFYKSKEWKQLKEDVLAAAHNECVKCKAKGKISKATQVHHVQWVKRHPGSCIEPDIYIQRADISKLTAVMP